MRRIDTSNGFKNLFFFKKVFFERKIQDYELNETPNDLIRDFWDRRLQIWSLNRNSRWSMQYGGWNAE